MKTYGIITFLLAMCLVASAQKTLTTDVLVIGGGTGGTAAGIQSARSGAKTIIAEAGPWLGGMISAAGVSAIDGNNRLPSGLWAEFRSHLYEVYGGPKGVETGWVSNTLFEPHVADSIFKHMATAEKNLTVLFRYAFKSIEKRKNKITSVRFINSRTGEQLVVKARIYVDATELGDVMKAAGVAYDLGMEADTVSGEKAGVNQSNDIVQDLTYVATLKDYGAGVDKTIEKPRGYDPAEFDGACADYYKDSTRKAPSVNAQKMLEYGKLPHGKYMINWPGYGNDTYLNVVELTPAQREKELVKAKETTLRFVYFIQVQLGFKQLGLADDEFPTGDKLALMPYYREGRRVKGLVRFTMRHIAEPYTYGAPLYRTGVAVGDYPIDHHHKKNPAAPQHLDFYPIPSYTIPLGALIPKHFDNLIVAEKGISVSNVANGTTRLQPVVLLTGQAAGVLAAQSVKEKQAPAKISIRKVQQQLLNAGAMILPYIDVPPSHPSFQSIQRIGATGILRGKGIPYKWANQTWFYPDSTVSASALAQDLSTLYKTRPMPEKNLSIAEACAIINALQHRQAGIASFYEKQWKAWGLKDFDASRPITRAELAVLFDRTVDPFHCMEPDYNGHFKTQ